MIPRYQRYLFWTLAAGIFLASLSLLRGCKQAHDRLATPEDETPIAAPTSAGEAGVTLLLASDQDSTIHVDTRALALPAEPTTRARVLLEHLLADYALPGSAHPLPSGAAIDDVFLLTLPIAPPASAGDTTTSRAARAAAAAVPQFGDNAYGQLAVINLHESFADNHPSGIETENLTLLSIIGTLHANFPDATQIRFLVDGRPRDTLAGHASLSRSYPATDTASTAANP